MPEIPEALPPETRIGPYKLLRAVGRGGFGITYRAWDEAAQRQVALKEHFPQGLCCREPGTGRAVPVSPACESAWERSLDDVFREAQTLANCRHPHIVPVYSVHRSHGTVCYAMPWLEGGTLADVLRREGPPGPARTEKMLRSLLSALAYLHRRGVLHRDIKAANIIFDENGEPVLIDFGAAVELTDRTVTMGPISPATASPEQLMGKGKLTPAADFYALAVTLYRALTGENFPDALSRHAGEHPCPLSRHPKLLHGPHRWPRALLLSIDRNLSLNPAARCQSAEEWLAALEEVPTAPRRLLKWAIPAAAALIMAAALAFALVEHRSTPPPAPTATQEPAKPAEIPADAQTPPATAQTTEEKPAALPEDRPTEQATPPTAESTAEPSTATASAPTAASASDSSANDPSDSLFEPLPEPQDASLLLPVTEPQATAAQETAPATSAPVKLPIVSETPQQTGSDTPESAVRTFRDVRDDPRFRYLNKNDQQQVLEEQENRRLHGL